MKKLVISLLSVLMVFGLVMPISANGEVTQHTVEKVLVVDGVDGYTPITDAIVGKVLLANVELEDGSVVGQYPANPNLKYTWYYEGTDQVLGTSATYTVTADNIGKTVAVKVEGIEEYAGSATWVSGSETRMPAICKISVVDGTDGYTPVNAPIVGQKLTANIEIENGDKIGAAGDSNLKYTWYYEGTDQILGEEAVYTVTSDNAGKTIAVKVVGQNAYSGEINWKASESVDKLTVTKVTVVDGTDGYTPVETPVVGQVLAANVTLENNAVIGTYPKNDNLKYTWYYEGTDQVLGTDARYTVTKDNVGKKIALKVEGILEYDGEAIWPENIEEPQPEVKPTTPTISCAGSKDKNCDGVVTCDEEKGTGWTWNNAKKVCEYTGNSGYQVVNTAVK